MDNSELKKIFENQVLIMKMLMSIMNPSDSDEPSYVIAFNASRAIENTENFINLL
jgi:hypothetical protein